MLLQWCRSESVCCGAEFCTQEKDRDRSVEDVMDSSVGEFAIQGICAEEQAGRLQIAEIKSRVDETSDPPKTGHVQLNPALGDCGDCDAGAAGGDGSTASTCSATSEASFGELSTSSCGASARLSEDLKTRSEPSQHKSTPKNGDLSLPAPASHATLRAPMTLLPSNTPAHVRFRHPSRRLKVEKHFSRPHSADRSLERPLGFSHAELRRSVLATERLLSAGSSGGRRGGGSSDSASGGRRRAAAVVAPVFRRPRSGLGAAFSGHSGGSGGLRGSGSAAASAGAPLTPHLSRATSSADLSPIVESCLSDHSRENLPTGFHAGPAPREDVKPQLEPVVRLFLQQEGFDEGAGANARKKTKGGGLLSSSGFTHALHTAVRTNDVEIVAALLRSGAHAKLADSQGLTALELAQRLDRRGSHQQVIECLRR